MAVRVNEEDFDKLVLQNDLPVLVDFYSDSCIPCKRMAGVIGDLEDENEGKIAVYKVNVPYSEKLVAEYSVMSAPTLIAFQNGKETGRLTGIQSKEALLALLGL